MQTMKTYSKSEIEFVRPPLIRNHRFFKLADFSHIPYVESRDSSPVTVPPNSPDVKSGFTPK